MCEQSTILTHDFEMRWVPHQPLKTSFSIYLLYFFNPSFPPPPPIWHKKKSDLGIIAWCMSQFFIHFLAAKIHRNEMDATIR